jgi:hypothetical protein
VVASCMLGALSGFVLRLTDTAAATELQQLVGVGVCGGLIVTDIAALLWILVGCAAVRAGLAVGGRIPAVVFDRRATKHPAKIRAALRVGAAPAPRRVAGSLNRTSAIRLASALRVIRWRSQRCYTSHGSGALVRRLICSWHMAAGQLAVFQGATRPQRFAQPRPHRLHEVFRVGMRAGRRAYLD